MLGRPPSTSPSKQPRFRSFFWQDFFSQNSHFEIKKRIEKHNFFGVQTTNLYLKSYKANNFEKKNVSKLLVTSTLRILD